MTRRALVSVTDKTGVVEFAARLSELSTALQATARASDDRLAAVADEVARMSARTDDIEGAAGAVADEVAAVRGLAGRLVQEVSEQVAALDASRDALGELTDRVVRQVVDERREKIADGLAASDRAEDRVVRLEAAVGHTVDELRAALAAGTATLDEIVDARGRDLVERTGTEVARVQGAVEELRRVVARAEDQLARLGELEAALRERATAPAPRPVVRRVQRRTEEPARVVGRSDGRTALRALLAEVEGLGVTQQERVLDEFGSLRTLRAATVADIATVHGIGRVLAERISAAAHH